MAYLSGSANVQCVYYAWGGLFLPEAHICVHPENIGERRGREMEQQHGSEYWSYPFK